MVISRAGIVIALGMIERKVNRRRRLMKTDLACLFETILIFVHMLGSLSRLVYFLHSLTILIYSQRPDFTAPLGTFSVTVFLEFAAFVAAR